MGHVRTRAVHTAVKQDLVISAYKPNGGLEDRFRLQAGTEDGAWDFVRSHLQRLPVFVGTDGRAEVIAERQSYPAFLTSVRREGVEAPWCRGARTERRCRRSRDYVEAA